MSEAQRAAFDRGYQAALEADEGKSLMVQFNTATAGQRYVERVTAGWTLGRKDKACA